MTLPSRSVCLYVDGAQNPIQLDRGIARYVSEHAQAIRGRAQSLLHSVLLNPGLPVTGNLNSFLGTGLLGWGSSGRPLGDLPRVYHVMSPFERDTAIDTMWPGWARDPRIATVVTLYDLIPLIFPGEYLVDPVIRMFYTARLELIRHADGVLAISQNTAEDAVERLQVSADRVHVIHAGTSEHLAGMYPSTEAARAHLARHLKSVRPGFVLFVGWHEFRKNMDGLIAAFGRLPATLRARHRLVIVCSLKPGESETLRSVATHAGLGPDELVLTGRVTDADLGALYRACTLFVFPSIYEGFGLPMLEAMSCGAPVAASVTATGPEVLGDLEGTFDPHDPNSIASCLAGILSSPDALERLRARSRRRVAEYTWKRVAERSIEAYETVVAGTRTRRRCRRPRIALVTPWPPQRSRVADYNVRLAAELGQRVDVDVIVGGPVDLYSTPRERGVRLMAVRDFERLRDLHQHDRVVYCMGNSASHGHVYELLKHQPGTVVLHEVRLTGFYRWYAGVERQSDPEAAFAERIHAMYGDRVTAEATQDGASTLERQAALGIYMTRELQSHADQCFVHSRSAREVLELDRSPLDRQVQVSVLPFGLPRHVEARRGVLGPTPLIVSLNSLHEDNGTLTLVDAFSLFAADMPAARLVIAGEAVDAAETDRWRSYASEHAPNACIELVGEVDAERHDELLRTADLAVHVQLVSNGDVPAGVADCVGSGLPTIVTELGWASELPPNVADTVPPGVTPSQLKDRMVSLLTDDRKRAAISQAAIDYAHACSFSTVADAYVGALGLG
jgi:glycosyltransferase involved in cell wall biosynthesis